MATVKALEKHAAGASCRRTEAQQRAAMQWWTRHVERAGMV
ncbi:hypothetical protein XFLM_03405 [Xylella fastidiosa subsp. fastidiosa GB514]|nr:hypothetical protein [Xylella fastidiosa]ADN62666.1 hypothetical protein XFLM_03405 [Xylella fastidiosa subsp. fastidiosa GB514]AIC14057.1 hypothetical protein P303_10355 [Xylella fastidiosa MUL0034]